MGIVKKFSFSSMFDLFIKPERFYENVSHPVNAFLFYELFIVLITALLGIFRLDQLTAVISVSGTDIITRGLFLSGVFIVLTVLPLVLTLLLHLFVRVYKGEKNYWQTLLIFYYATFPALIVSLFAIIKEDIYLTLFVHKPFLLLLLSIFTFYIMLKGLEARHKITAFMAGCAELLWVLLIYVIALRIYSTIVFYLLVFLLLYKYRDKFEVHAPALIHRTKLGLKAMDKLSARYPRFFKYLSIIGVGFGFLGMLGICVLFIYEIIKLFITPAAQPGVAPILPGIPIPGQAITLPLVYGVISLFVVVVIHEFSHGVIARLHGLKVKSSGILFIGPLIAAFVEPDEEAMKKKKKLKQISVFAAGPFSNLLCGVLVIVLILAVFNPLVGALVEPKGIIFTYADPSPVKDAGINEGEVITAINDIDVIDTNSMRIALQDVLPGDEVRIMTNESWYVVSAADSPSNPGHGFIGVMPSNFVKPKKSVESVIGETAMKYIFTGFGYILKFFNWFFMITVGLGLINLLPLGAVDGGRMLQAALLHFFSEKTATDIWKKVSVVFLLILLALIFFPLFKWIVPQI